MSEKRFSRKGFLGHLFGSFASLAGELLEDTFNRIEEVFPPILLPPGAGKSLERFMETCKRCGDCVRACPYFVIKRNLKRGSLVEGLPCLAYRDSYCRMCSDSPCINACPTGALQKPEAGWPKKIGIARVYPEKCLRSAGQDCQSCLGKCLGPQEANQPIPQLAHSEIIAGSGSLVLPGGMTLGRVSEEHLSFGDPGSSRTLERSAISLVGNLPEIDSELCTGCGACEFHCPVRPGSAVVVED